MTALVPCRRTLNSGLLLLASTLTACGGDRPVASSVDGPQFARGGPPTAGPTVTSTTPSTSPRSLTLNVTVAGSGFDQGSRAVWALAGDTTFAKTKVKTNSTTYVSAKQITANITIAADAPIAQYDVQVVTFSGRKGIGIELFAVTGEIIDLGAGDNSFAEAVNDRGQVVGGGGAGVGGFIWENGTIRRLPLLPGMSYSWAYDINESGQVVGYSSTADGSSSQAFVWTAAGGMQALAGTLGGPRTQADGINDQGLIVGIASLPNGDGGHIVVWENGVMRDGQTFATGSTTPWDLNNAGMAVGQWDPSNSAFAWTASGGTVALAGLGGTGSIPLASNDLGQVVGWYRKGTATINTAFLWENGVIRDLGTLGGASSVGMAINSSGQVVGRADVPVKGTQHVHRAFLWTAAAGMKDLGSITGRQWAQALDINETGWVVGQTWLSSGASRATLWKIK